MNTNPYTSPNSPAGECSNNHAGVVTFISWVLWCIICFGVLVLYLYAYNIRPDINHWAIGHVGVFSMAILLPLAFLFGLFFYKKQINPWLRLLVYTIALFIILMFFGCGFFSVNSGDYTLIAVGVISLASLCPLINKKRMEDEDIKID